MSAPNIYVDYCSTTKRWKNDDAVAKDEREREREEEEERASEDRGERD